MILCSLVCFTSCGIYKPYHRPEVETDDLFGETYQEKDTTSLRDLQWQELFTNPYLQELIYRGLENNYDLQSAQLTIRQAEAALMTVRLAFLPSLHLAPEGALSSFDGSAATKTYTLPVASSWEIDVFGRLQNAKKGSKAAYLQTKEYKQAVRTGLISAITNYYYTLLMLDMQYEITAHTAESWRESLETMQAMKEAGMTTEAGVRQIEGTYYATKASLEDIRQQITEVENALSLLLMETPQPVKRGRMEEQTFPTELSTGIPLQLLAWRPDVRSAEYALMEAHYVTNEARASLYPSLKLSGVAGWTNSAGSYIVNPGKLLLTAAGSLTQPLFNKGIHKSKVKISQARQQDAALNFQQTLLNAGAEVNNTLAQYQAARNKQEIRVKQIAAMEQALESTELLMRHGSTTYLEILTARQSLLSAQLAGISDRYSEIQSIINLYRALGGGREIAEYPEK
ncbi:MAG: TolC family protein [Bacteroides sp.]|nr:TolC family protein [Bacteroides sp.]